ncbi:ATP-binding cassette domain-containing protein, partial [Escherichia coli]|nr:ATP-binding cassette domain-containing protein [Escherichia coli]
ITGPSGSGKSTILKLLNGLIPELYPGELHGEVRLAGRVTTATPIQELGRAAGTVFQNPRAQFFTAKVLEELAFAGE